MSDVTYKLFANTAGDSVATIDIQDDGFIEGIWFDMVGAGMDALSDTAVAEIGFGSTNTFSSNDVRSSIAMMRINQNFLTSGGGVGGKIGTMNFLKGIPVSAGERVHLHTAVSSGVTIDVQIYLYVVTTRGVVRRATRRRR